jgi:molybdopterin molybdotransferase
VGFNLVEKRGKLTVLNVEQALEAILKYIRTLDMEEVGLLDSPGQVTFEDTYARMNVPGWDCAAMDGFAVQSQDTSGAGEKTPRLLQVIEDVQAGSAAGKSVTPGTAIRIMTGAPIPSGADCVVRFEDTDEEKRNRHPPGKKEIGIYIESETGKNIRPTGEVVTMGALVIAKGTVVGPGEMGILSSLGHTSLKVIRRPVIAIIASGEELVAQGKALYGPQIYNSNSYCIAAQVKRCGGIPKLLGIARDKKSSIISRLKQGLKADIIITCGGASVGDYDLIKEAAAEIGEVVFQGVNMAPGKPFSFGLIEDTSDPNTKRTVPLFSLSGNPSASMMDFEILVRPAVLKMQGRNKIFPKTIKAILQDSFENKKHARCFVWAQINEDGHSSSARISRIPEKGILPSVAAANGLVIIPEEKRRVEKGQTVEAILLDWV